MSYTIRFKFERGSIYIEDVAGVDAAVAIAAAKVRLVEVLQGDDDALDNVQGISVKKQVSSS